MKTEKLASILALNGDSWKKLAVILGITPQTISRKKNGKCEFSSKDVSEIAHHYNLTPEEVYEIFFA